MRKTNPPLVISDSPRTLIIKDKVTCHRCGSVEPRRTMTKLGDDERPQWICRECADDIWKNFI